VTIWGQELPDYDSSPKIGGEAINIVDAALEGVEGPPGPAGPAGPAGATWYSGVGVPSNTLGVNGDLYLDRTPGAYSVYGPKAAGVWGTGQSIMGTAGPAGATGPTGPAGPAGNTNLAYIAASRLITSDTGTDATLPEASTTVPGLMSAADKAKLDGLTEPGDSFLRLDSFPVVIGISIPGSGAITPSTSVPAVTIRAPFAFTLTEIRASLGTSRQRADDVRPPRRLERDDARHEADHRRERGDVTHRRIAGHDPRHRDRQRREAARVR
jgi:hypothetical protein